MDRQTTFFYVSGVIAFTLFFALLLLFTQFLFMNDSAKNFALKNAEFLSVSIMLNDPKPVSKIQKKVPEPVQQKVSEPKSEKSLSAPADISSLFSNVQAKKVVYDKHAPVKQIKDTQISQIQKRIQTTEKRDSDISKKLESLELIKMSSREAPSASSAKEVNEYLATIQNVVYENFFPPVNSEGNSAKIRIWLDANGVLKDFRVLAYSGSSLFNTETDRLSTRLKSITFPKNPDSRAISIDIILMAKE